MEMYIALFFACFISFILGTKLNKIVKFFGGKEEVFDGIASILRISKAHLGSSLNDLFTHVDFMTKNGTVYFWGVIIPAKFDTTREIQKMKEAKEFFKKDE